MTQVEAYTSGLRREVSVKLVEVGLMLESQHRILVPLHAHDGCEPLHVPTCREHHWDGASNRPARLDELHLQAILDQPVEDYIQLEGVLLDRVVVFTAYEGGGTKETREKQKKEPKKERKTLQTKETKKQRNKERNKGKKETNKQRNKQTNKQRRKRPRNKQTKN